MNDQQAIDIALYHLAKGAKTGGLSEQVADAAHMTLQENLAKLPDVEKHKLREILVGLFTTRSCQSGQDGVDRAGAAQSS